MNYEFKNKELGNIRVVEHDGRTWFVAMDIAQALGYDKPLDAIETHCKNVNKIPLLPETGNRQMLIPKSDVDRLIVKCPTTPERHFYVLNTSQYVVTKDVLNQDMEEK